MIGGTNEREKIPGRNENGDRKARRMSYTIHTYKPCETFRMHIRLPRWPTVDFRPGRELTFALPLCANSHKDSLSLPSLIPLAIPLFHSLFLSFYSESCLLSSRQTLALSLADVYDNVLGNALKFRVKSPSTHIYYVATLIFLTLLYIYIYIYMN